MTKKTSSDNVGAFFSAYLWLKEDKKSSYEKNVAFLERIGVPKCRWLYVSKTTPTVIALISYEERLKAESDGDFSDMSPYSFDVPLKSEDDILLYQIGTGSPLFNNGTGYSGSGISVGIIAAENLTFDPYAKSLDGVDITVLPSLLPPRIDTHPTAVTSQIVGKEVTVGETTYFGVARNAKAYFYSAKTAKNVYEAIEKMAELGVRVINYSAGIVKGEYSDFDRQVDRLIRAGNFLFVTVSGNTRELTSPGRAYNSVAVGNLVTKSYPDTPLPPPWSVWCKSEDDCSGFNGSGVHKPDLVAPGGWVGYVDRTGEVNFANFGTSFACPWVSGVGAVLWEATEERYSYLTVKGLILMSCNADSVSADNDPEIAPYMHLRSGYGLLDGARAVEMLVSCEIYESRLDGEYDIEIEGGDLEIMLVIEKGDTDTVLKVDGEEYRLGEQNTLLIKKRSRESVTPLSVIGFGGGRFSVIVFRRP